MQASTSEVYGDPEIHPQVESYRGNVNPIGIRACYDEGKRAAEALFFESLKNHFFYLVPHKRERNNPQLRKMFFDAVLHVLQDPKIQRTALKGSTRKSKAYWLAFHKIKDIKEMFCEKSEINSFENAA